MKVIHVDFNKKRKIIGVEIIESVSVEYKKTACQLNNNSRQIIKPTYNHVWNNKSNITTAITKKQQTNNDNWFFAIVVSFIIGILYSIFVNG